MVILSPIVRRALIGCVRRSWAVLIVLESAMQLLYDCDDDDDVDVDNEANDGNVNG